MSDLNDYDENNLFYSIDEIRQSFRAFLQLAKKGELSDEDLEFERYYRDGKPSLLREVFAEELHCAYVHQYPGNRYLFHLGNNPEKPMTKGHILRIFKEFMKAEWKGNADAAYALCLVILTIYSCFFPDNETMERNEITWDTVIEKIDRYMDAVLSRSKEEVSQAENTTGLSLTTIANFWKSLDNGSRSKDKTSFFNVAVRFLKENHLVDSHIGAGVRRLTLTGRGIAHVREFFSKTEYNKNVFGYMDAFIFAET